MDQIVGHGSVDLDLDCAERAIIGTQRLTLVTVVDACHHAGGHDLAGPEHPAAAVEMIGQPGEHFERAPIDVPGVPLLHDLVVGGQGDLGVID